MSIQTKVSEQSVKSLEEIKICIAYQCVCSVHCHNIQNTQLHDKEYRDFSARLKVANIIDHHRYLKRSLLSYSEYSFYI